MSTSPFMPYRFSPGILRVGCMMASGEDKVGSGEESTARASTAHSLDDSVGGMPIAINTSRPSSAASIQAPSPTNINASARTTTTSRRGGRTRSRSPPVMGTRYAGGGDGMPPTNGDNPSSAAAAAAAAAAKAFSSNGGRTPASWPDEDLGFHAYEKPYSGGPAKWPGEDSRSHYGSPPLRYSQAGGSYEGHELQPRGSPYGSSPTGDMDDRRYRDMRKHSYEQQMGPSRGMMGHSSHGSYHMDYRQGRDHHRETPSRSHRSSNGTSIVLGGPTPIHVPKRHDSHMEQQRGPASVFRRPDSRRVMPQEPDDESPQKILMSLRTPSTSFEERPTERTRKTTGLTLSPDDPPQIQNSHLHRSTDPLFEPQRSPGDPKMASIDIAPSFNLFNQSFDSFGDAHYFSVDNALQADSFGMTRTNSIEHDGTNGIIQRNSSGGNFSHQFLAGSGSGALTIGYSPVNSFGNASASLIARRNSGGNVLLGGPDTRAASPTQVLGMYRSYSGGGSIPRPGSMDENHMRMNVGSFGGQSYSYGRSYGESAASPSYYPPPSRSPEGGERTPPFYILLRKYKTAFKDCTFLLPGLKAALLEAPLSTLQDSSDPDPVTIEGAENGPSWEPSMNGVTSHLPYRSSSSPAVYSDPLPQDIAIARRRVECSVCAFGGNLNRERTIQDDSSRRGGIFRSKEEPDTQHSATVTPSSTEASSAARFTSRARMKYEEALTGRYYENESRLSWEFEEAPPIEIPPEEDPEADKGDHNGSKSDCDSKDSKMKSENDSYCKAVGDSDDKHPTSASPQPKMRYRCKLCGQPKQNHRCPYQQSLARSIGVMVYPAVNAFTASEPGLIAAPLSEMNNFVDVQKDGVSSGENSPNRPTPERIRRMTAAGPMPTLNQVTPESMRSTPRQIQSPLSFASVTPGKSSHRNAPNRHKKRLYSQFEGADEHGDLLFVESMDLKPEQFRIVTQSKSRKGSEGYTYPALPLPYAQRKRLSDNLFTLSNEVPKLTDECAQVLREAREKDMWDLAVAELMTQVIVVIHCPEGDSRFEGLRQYLLTLGIAC